jgi:hypothetical protein
VQVRQTAFHQEADMTNFSKRALFWVPRALSIVFIAFLSIFALDVFDEKLGFWQTLLAFLIHQIPVFVLILVLILAWKWEWIGTALYGLLGLLYIVWIIFVPRTPFPPAARAVMSLGIAGPLLVLAWLFWVNWRKHGELREIRH